MANNNSIKIDLGFATLVAERNLCFNDAIRELMIYLTDNSGAVLQDIAIVRQKYHVREDECATDENEFVNEDTVEVLVFSDRNSEDYTKKFNIRPIIDAELKALRKGDEILVQYRDGRRPVVKFLDYVEDAENYEYTVIFEEEGEKKSLPGTAYCGRYYPYK